MSFPVFDLHCDTAYALLGNSLHACGALQQNEYHIDLTRAQQLSGYAQCFACFTTTEDVHPVKINPVELFEREMATVLREIERNPDKIRLCYCAEDAENNRNNGLISAFLTIEGPAGFGFDPDLLQDLYQVGFRMTTLCWNESNPLTGSHATGGHLTDLGKDFVRKAQQVGMIVDLSHISDEAFWDVMEITQGPVIASHSNSRTLCNHSRNITDEMFAALCKVDGVVGVNLYKDFLGDSADLNTVCDHILHFLSLDPDGTHIALGGDLDGCDQLPDGFTGIQDYNKLAQCMLSRGISETQIRKIFWDNAFEVIKRCCM